MHIVDLPDAEAARVFAFEEPCYVAGVYSEAMVRRWHNALGRTMWEFEGDPDARSTLSRHRPRDPGRERRRCRRYGRNNASTYSRAAISST